MEPNPRIFRKYDIRGIVGDDLNPAVARAVGRAYAAEFRAAVAGAPRIAVGEDNRPSSPALRQGLVDGLCASGCSVTELGTVPTPVAYFAEHHFGADGAIQITGSHNPPEYNGIKMTFGRRSVHGEAIQRLRGRIRARDFRQGNGRSGRRSVLPAYIADLCGRVRLARPVRVVVDCGNGAGAVVAVELLRALGAEVIPLYCESDGTFPNHHPDPTVDENIVDLIAAVQRHGAELGIGFDGDADRIGAVDDRGKVVRGDILLLLFGLDLLRRRGGGETLVFDVKCSQVLPEVFERAGGVPVMWKTGHSLIKEKMKETGAALAGELSGHICFADDYYGFDDALYAACRLLALLAASELPLSGMTSGFPAYCSTPEIRIEVPEEVKFGIVARAREHFAARREVIAVDGVRVLFGDGWGLVRASNTQPVIVARYEARSAHRLEEIREVMEGWMRRQGVPI